MRHTLAQGRGGPLLIVALVSAICLPARAYAQEKTGAVSSSSAPDFPVLTYENGHLLSPYLPYSTPFIITGSRTTFKGTADVVIGEIYPGDAASGGRGQTQALQSSCWTQFASTPGSDDFRLVFAPLTLGRSYWVQLTFAKAIDTSLTNPAIRNTLVAFAAQRAQSPAPSAGEIATSVTQQVVKVLTDAMGGATSWLTVVGEGKCSITTKIAFAFSVADSIRFLQGVAASRDANSAAAQLADVRRSRPPGDITPLAAALRAARENRKNTALVYTLADVQQLVAAAQQDSGGVLSVEAGARLDSVLLVPRATPLELHGQTTALVQYLEYFGKLRSTEQARADANQRKSAALGAVAVSIANRYTPIASGSITETSWGDTSAVRKLQIGTAMSGAATYIGSGASDAVLIGALRYYLAPVDRSLPHPWSSKLARFAINVGTLVKSTIRYRGQAQGSVFAGLTPTVGMSFDASRYLSLGGGAVIFRQPSTNPLADPNTSHVRLGLYLGLGTDLDALNRIQSFLSPGG